MLSNKMYLVICIAGIVNHHLTSVNGMNHILMMMRYFITNSINSNLMLILTCLGN